MLNLSTQIHGQLDNLSEYFGANVNFAAALNWFTHAPGGQPFYASQLTPLSMGNQQARRAPMQKPQHASQKVAQKPNKSRGNDMYTRLPTGIQCPLTLCISDLLVVPRRQCLLRLLRQTRVEDYLKLEEEFIRRRKALRPTDLTRRQENQQVQDLRGSPVILARIHELFDDERVSTFMAASVDADGPI